MFYALRSRRSELYKIKHFKFETQKKMRNDFKESVREKRKVVMVKPETFSDFIANNFTFIYAGVSKERMVRLIL